MNIHQKKVTILGAQRSGLALARLVVQNGGVARISHGGPEASIASTDLEWLNEHQVELEHNGHSPEFIRGSDYVVISPGVRLDSRVIQWVTGMLITVMGEVEFASEFCDVPIIAVTGSNGKTTVSTLIHQTLTAAGYKSRLCGNIGLPFSEACQDLAGCDYVVLEVSSFQMESVLAEYNPDRRRGYVRGFRPMIGVLLNFSQNHLDRHRDMDEYFFAKARLFINQEASDYAVLNTANPRIKTFGDTLKSQVRPFGGNSGKGDSSGDLNPNFLAIHEVMDILKIDRSYFEKVLKDFKGVEHRLEFVRNIDGVKYINDSKSTTAEAGRWALNQTPAPLLFICGGRDKNMDYSVIRDLVAERVDHLILIGEARAKIRQALESVCPITECDSLDEAVRFAQQQAKAGDTVLFSPMCASFDMFRDYEERGRVFKSLVNALKVESHA